MTFIIGSSQPDCKSEHNQVKSHGTCGNLTVYFLIYKVVHYLNDFRNLLLDKVYLKK